MRERFRVLAGTLKLREFTIAQLAELTGVKTNTVRTILHREPEFFVCTGRELTGQPGGQVSRYRVKETSMEALQQRLKSVVSEFKELELPPDIAGIPATLLVAEHALLNRLPVARTPEQRDQALAAARAAWQAALREIDANPLYADGSDKRKALNPHLYATEALLRHETSGGDALGDPHSRLVPLQQALSRAIHALYECGQKDHALAFFERAQQLEIAIGTILENSASAPVLIDAISASPGKVLARLEAALLTVDAVHEVKRISWRRATHRRLRDGYRMLFVAVDSDRDGVEVLHEIANNLIGSMYVFDASSSIRAYDAVLRLRRGIRYFPNVLNLSDDALSAAIHDPFDELAACSGIPARRILGPICELSHHATSEGVLSKTGQRAPVVGR